MKKTLFLFLLLTAFTGGLLMAQTGTVKGKVKNELNQVVGGAKVEALGTNVTSRTTEGGNYSIVLPSGELYRIRFTHPTHDTTVIEVRVAVAKIHDKPVTMQTRSLEEQVLEGRRQVTDITSEEQMEILPIRTEDIIKIPTAVPSIEQLVGVIAGGSSNEFSSQYRVRGGNFDENLIYVNGIEIYRPFLARAGQQEGLGFTNPYMADDIYFSTGGFSARYGDKMSSMLDVTYRTPQDFAGTAEVGILTQGLHLEGAIRGKEPVQDPDDATVTKPSTFTWLLGFRRFSTTYLLNSLETSGQYKPNFLDLQTMFTWTPKTTLKPAKIRTRKNGSVDTLYYPLERVKLTAFMVTSRNNYFFEPQARQTTFGTIQQAFRLRVAFEGQEVTRYTTGLGAIMLTHQPNVRTRFDYTVTAFRTQESELFDVEGGYLLGEVNTNFGSDEFNESEFDLGIGTEFRHARNYLTADVLAGQFRGEWTPNNRRRHKFFFGLKYVYQDIQDDIKEYNARDSAGYFVDQNGQFGVLEFIRGSASLKSNTFKAYLQDRWQLNKSLTLHLGLRGLYYDLTDELLFSPRVQLIYDASKKKGGPNLRLRFAWGVYHQNPFYREFRRLDGTLNLGINSQTAIHYIAGLDYQFQGWGRTFRLFSEIYYKDLRNLIPYEIQNVRIRYYPDYVADGYAWGIDARVHGQFIKGVDSWISLNLLSTKENVIGDTVGYIPRPTDQRFAMSFYFQDELPINPTYKVHVNFIYGSGLRFGPPATFEYRTAFQYPSYQRVDLGFSKIFHFHRPSNKGLESIWATIEIFNLFGRSNTVSYVWIRDLEDRLFAVPNNLSSRLINARVVFKFR